MRIRLIFILFLGMSLSSFAQEDVPQVNPHLIVQEGQPYTWADFLMEKSCMSQLILLQDHSVGRQNDIKDKIRAYCKDPAKVWHNLLTIFRENKKDVLMHQIFQDNIRLADACFPKIVTSGGCCAGMKRVN